MSEQVIAKCQSKTCNGLINDLSLTHCPFCKAPLSMWDYVQWLMAGKIGPKSLPEQADTTFPM